MKGDAVYFCVVRIKPAAAFPTKRLVVFAGTLPGSRSTALWLQEAEAVMVSFEAIRKNKSWWDKWSPLYDEWPHYRYLDSGVFTLMRQAGVSRVKAQTQPKAQQKATKKKALPYKILKETRKRVVIPQAMIHERFLAYKRYLTEHLDEWDFVINFDIDQLDIERKDGKIVSGMVVAERMTEQLYEICGGKLMVVYHPATMNQAYFEDLVSRFDYIAVGSDAKLTNRQLKYACDYIHSKGKKAHGLAVGHAVLSRVPFDTADCSTWINGVVYGIYVGINFGLRSKNNTYDERHAWLEKVCKEEGFDPSALYTSDTTGPNATTKFALAIALFQRKQSKFRPIAKPHHPIRLPID